METGWTARALGLLASVALAASACTGDDRADSGSDAAAEPASRDEPEAATVFPGDDWAHADAEDLGFDARTLEEIAAEAGANGSSCLLVARDGRIAGEWYWNGTDAETLHETHSVTKSYAGTLVGIAQDEGHLDIDDKASDYVDEWVGTPSADITVGNLVGRDDGLHFDHLGSPGFTEWLASADRTAAAIALDQDHPPGTRWAINEASVQTLDAVLREATGREPADYAREKLLDPIGARRTEMTKDDAGNTNLFSLLRTTCRDAARFGHLFAQEGNWDGTQVVSREWVAGATRSSQDLFAGYGYLWWLNRPGEIDPDRVDFAGVTPPDRQMVPGAPEDMYWAFGAFGQVVLVDPGSGTVVVRFGTGDLYDTAPIGTAARVVTDALRS